MELTALRKKLKKAALSFTVNSSKFLIGDFINALLAFVLLAAIVYYFVVVPVSRLMDRVSPPAAVTTRECQWCLSKIPLKARRCAFCTADVEDKVQATIDEMTAKTTPV